MTIVVVGDAKACRTVWSARPMTVVDAPKGEMSTTKPSKRSLCSPSPSGRGLGRGGLRERESIELEHALTPTLSRRERGKRKRRSKCCVRISFTGALPAAPAPAASRPTSPGRSTEPARHDQVEVRKSVVTFSAIPCMLTAAADAHAQRADLREFAALVRHPHADRAGVFWAGMPNSPSVAMTVSSSRRTNPPTDSRWSLSRTIGYATTCPGPWNVTSPPRSDWTTSTPSCLRDLGGRDDVSFDARPATERDNGRVLDEQKLLLAARHNLGVRPLLRGPCVAVRHDSKIGSRIRWNCTARFIGPMRLAPAPAHCGSARRSDALLPPVGRDVLPGELLVVVGEAVTGELGARRC